MGAPMGCAYPLQSRLSHSVCNIHLPTMQGFESLLLGALADFARLSNETSCARRCLLLPSVCSNSSSMALPPGAVSPSSLQFAPVFQSIHYNFFMMRFCFEKL